MPFIAHIREIDGEIQTVEQHLIAVKSLAEVLGDKLNVRHLAGLAGMLHDLGKFSEEFRCYIIEAVKNPDAPPKRGSVDHSTAGGRLLYQLYHAPTNSSSEKMVAQIVGNTIISHHSDLQDYMSPDLSSPFLTRVRDKEAPELAKMDTISSLFFSKVISREAFADYVRKAIQEFDAYIASNKEDRLEKKVFFLTKFLFSTLIDADRTDTRIFEEKSKIENANGSEKLQQYYTKLLQYVATFSADTPINALRARMSIECEQHAKKPSGIYTLSIPTGGGKTLSSLRYSLKHSITHGKQRIIYIVPYTTIIEQNAEEVRCILQDEEGILEHHSNVIYDQEDDDESTEGAHTTPQKLMLAKDNWDSPIIFTTLVQFLNVFYAKGNRNTRRLHNLTNAVVIFDEVQKVPTNCISMFNEALNFLYSYGRSSILLCTATQPALDLVRNKLRQTKDAEIIKNIDRIIDEFKRVEIVDLASKQIFTTDALAQLVEDHSLHYKSQLIILNTKKAVKDLYETLKEKMPAASIKHLSTSMCPAHRKEIIEETRQYLQELQPVILISTQLIEAGVNISFESVIRSLAGLDSIAQAAGRCNRHGEKESGTVFVIDHQEEQLSKLKEIQVGKIITKKMLLDQDCFQKKC